MDIDRPCPILKWRTCWYATFCPQSYMGMGNREGGFAYTPLLKCLLWSVFPEKLCQSCQICTLIFDLIGKFYLFSLSWWPYFLPLGTQTAIETWEKFQVFPINQNRKRKPCAEFHSKYIQIKYPKSTLWHIWV